MEVIIVRHGECLGQCDPNITGPDTALSERGRRQAARTAQRLAGNEITHVISSPLVRALATATSIAEAQGDLPVQVWLELRELWVGMYQGYNRTKLQQEFGRAVFPTSITGEGWNHVGDTYEGVYARCHEVIGRLWEEFRSNDRIVLVTHGGMANYLLHTFLQIPPQNPCWFELENCSITRLQWLPVEQRTGWPPLYPPVEIEVLSLNDVAHLTE